MLIRVYTESRTTVMVVNDAQTFETRQALMLCITERALEHCKLLGLEFTGFEIMAL